MISVVRSGGPASQAAGWAPLPNLRISPRICGAVLWCVLASSAHAQSPPPIRAVDNALLERWVREGPREDIRWTKRIHTPYLSLHQRLLTRLEIEVPIKELVKRRGPGKLGAILRITDSSGGVYRDDGDVDLQNVNPKARKQAIVFAWDTFMLPGEYAVVLALYDTATGERSFAQRSLRVAAIKSDPLPEAWKDLPPVEILVSPDEPDAYFHPEVKGRLRLPLSSKRPVRMELLFNLTPSEGRARAASSYSENLRLLLPVLKSLAQIDVRNGVLDVATLDLTHRRVGFEQDNVSNLDWGGLRSTLKAGDPVTVDVNALRERKENAAFLRKELERRIESKTGRPGEEPLRVFVLVSSTMAFEYGADLKPITRHEKCDCLIYYVRCERLLSFQLGSRRFLLQSSPDEIEGIVKPLKPRVFSVDSPGGIRKALAIILGEIAQMSAAN